MLEPRESVRLMKEYHPPLAGRVGLRLDFNENTVGCSPRVMATLQQLDREELARYPEREPAERVAAAFLGLPPSHVMLTNGVDEAIHLVCETYLEPHDEAIIVVPTFAMYEICTQATGARAVCVQADADFRFPTGKVLDRIGPRTRLIAIANPNNPTGAVVSQTDLMRLAEAAPNAAVLVDEAYFDFYGETMIDKLEAAPNVFVTRTFSKTYGLAGLRIGVLANAHQIPMVRRVASPYNLNSVALACLPEALGDTAYVREYVEQVRRGRARLERALDDESIKYWPSEANFVLAHFGSAREAFIKGMRDRGILVRDRHTDPGCEGCVRITLGTDQQTDRLLTTLHDVLNEIRVR